MTSENRTISLDEFVKYFLKKWKVAAICIVVFTVAFVAMTKIVGGEISVPHSEEYLYYEKESAWLENYLETSILMQMNPTEIPEVTLFLETDMELKYIKDYVLSKEIWEDFQTDRTKDYLYELLTWQKKDAAVIVRHVTKEECLETAEYIREKLQKYDVNMQITVGELRVVKDEELQEEQLRWYDRIEYSNSLLLEAEAGYTIEVNVIAAAATGVLTGGMVSLVLVLCMHLTEKKKKYK